MPMRCTGLNMIRCAAREVVDLYEKNPLEIQTRIVNLFKTAEPGSGSGSGGGGGGPIRSSGGSLGKRGATLEDQYFRKKERSIIQQLKKKLRLLRRGSKKK